ncbi:MAG TPA: hypothetical protein VGM86_22430 [Thermoanaerobaculia bacterium]|jgi:hypothetical protein
MKVEIGNLIVHVDTMEELDKVVQRYGESSRIQSVPSSKVLATQIGNRAASSVSTAEERPEPPALPVQSRPLIKSASKKDAMLKLFKSLKYEGHRNAIKFLALLGEEGANKEELQKAAGFPAEHKMSGFRSAITRRAPSFGLDPDEVMLVDSLGIVAGDRIYRYRLSQEMIEMLREQGFVGKEDGE